MRGKWRVSVTQSDGHLIMSSGDLFHDDWVSKFVSRYMKCMNEGDIIYIHQINSPGKRLINPVFSYKEYDEGKDTFVSRRERN